MNQPKVSVIVAVFNAEKTLDRMVQSLISQTFTDFEVLLIDDGSTDASGVICDKYARSDSRFKAFHKPNEGIGSTRQFGIDHAAGEYTIHVDSDDWVEPDYLECLLGKAESTGADMVICDFWEENGEKSTYSSQEFSTFGNSINPLDLFRLNGCPWNKLIRRSSYQERGIEYRGGLNFGEDVLFNVALILTGISVSYLPRALYHYDLSVNSNSAIHDISVKQILHRERYIDYLRKLMPEIKYRVEIDSMHLWVAYLAIQSKCFTKEQFKERYGFLSRVQLNNYHNISFPINLIVWTSLHCSYNLALSLFAVKKVKRRIFNS